MFVCVSVSFHSYVCTSGILLFLSGICVSPRDLSVSSRDLSVPIGHLSVPVRDPSVSTGILLFLWGSFCFYGDLSVSVPGAALQQESSSHRLHDLRLPDGEILRRR